MRSQQLRGRWRTRTPVQLLLAAVLVFGVFGLGGCGEREKKELAPKPTLDNGRVVIPQGSPQLALITTAKAKPSGPPVVRLNGRLVWNEDRTVRLFPAFAGRVSKILAKPGDTVKSGQTLAMLASPDFGIAQAESHKAATDYALAEKSLARTRDLVQNGVAPRKELNAAEADFARAEAELARVRARLKLYGGGDTVDQNFALKSPIAGTVVERNINPGQELRPDLASGSAPAMFVITDPQHLWVQLDASERDLVHIKAGRPVSLHSAAYPNETFPARIDVVSDFIDATSRTIKIRGSLDNAARKLKGEMFVTAEIEGDMQAAVDVPARAVFLHGDKYYVFVEEAPGRYRPVEVKSVGEPNGSIAIATGLQAGQTVVVDGSLLLQKILSQLKKS